MTENKEMKESDISVEQVDKALAVGHIPSGLFIVCAREGEMTDGYLASWIQQVSFDPLMISLAIKPGRPCYDWIMKGNNFSINIVGDHNKNFLKHFWKGYDPNSNPFSEIEHEIRGTGVVCLKEAKSVLECRFSSKCMPGDHEVVFAEVLASHIFDENAKSLTHTRKSGLNY